MPAWAQIVLTTAGVITAIAVIWNKVIKPGSKLVTNADEILPLLPVLQAIAKQFDNNGGSTLRDAIDRLEKQVSTNSEIITKISVDVGVHKGMSAEDRRHLNHLMVMVGDLRQVVMMGSAGIIRMEEDTKLVAEKLQARQELIDRINHWPEEEAEGRTG